MEYVVTALIGIDLKGTADEQMGDPDGELMRHIDDVMKELAHRWVADSSVELDLGRCEATFSLLVEAGDQERAISQGRGVLSMAIHSARGSTPHRPFPRDATWSVRVLGTRARPAHHDKRLQSPGLHLVV